MDVHDWHLADAEAGIEARQLAPDRFQLRHPDGRVEDLDAAGWDRWRSGEVRPGPPAAGVVLLAAPAAPATVVPLAAAPGNPNPARITGPVWRLWTDRPVTSWRLGGIYANKSGYHNTRAANQRSWPGNYSIRLSLDQQGPSDKAAAIDYTMSDAEMRRRTQYLADAASARDPRLSAVREFYGTLNSRTVYGRIKDTRSGTWRTSSADNSHLWHIHISLFRADVGDWNALAGLLSVLRGESLTQWRSQGAASMLCKHGDQGAHVGALQRMILEAGGSLPRYGVDSHYGNETRDALKSIVGGNGTNYGGKEYAKLHAAVAAKAAGDKGDRGPAGPAGPGPTPQQIQQAVEQWMQANADKVRGPKGDPGKDGKTPIRIAISGEVIDVA